MDAMLFEPAPKITAAKKKPTAPAKTSIAPSVKGGVVMKPEAVSDAEFESIEAALPEEETALRAPAVQNRQPFQTKPPEKVPPKEKRKIADGRHPGNGRGRRGRRQLSAGRNLG